MALTKDQLKKYSGYALVALSVTPQILFAVGAVYPPAAAAAVALQNFLSVFGVIQPGLVQAGVAAGGGKLLQESKPTNLSVPDAAGMLADAKFNESTKVG